MTRLIALLTDFGTTDAYVGVMKGVMLGICPDAALVDLSHDVQPQNLKQAAFLLLNNYRFFPPGTVFLVVVDPGVGTSRKAIAVRAGGYSFVAPDNGVLSYALREFGSVQAVEISNPAYQLARSSATFHGRDIFAPAAAHLAAGAALESFGSPVDPLVALPAPRLQVEGSRITGEVLHVDHFGSLVTGIGVLAWNANQLTLTPRFGDAPSLSFAGDRASVVIGAQRLSPIRHTYGEVGRGEALALVGSSGFLELSVNSASFRSLNVAQIGSPVEVQIG